MEKNLHLALEAEKQMKAGATKFRLDFAHTLAQGYGLRMEALPTGCRHTIKRRHHGESWERG